MSFHILVPVGGCPLFAEDSNDFNGEPGKPRMACLSALTMTLLSFFVETKWRNRNVHSSLWGKRSVRLSASICEKFWQLQIEHLDRLNHVHFLLYIFYVWFILHVLGFDLVSCFYHFLSFSMLFHGFCVFLAAPSTKNKLEKGSNIRNM